MNKIASALCALTLAVSLAACGSEDAPAPAQPTVTVTAEPESQSTDELLVEVVRDEYPNLDATDEQLVELGHASCDALDAGASADDVLGLILDSSSNPETQDAMAFTIGVGVGSFCPEHLDEFKPGTAS